MGGKSPYGAQNARTQTGILVAPAGQPKQSSNQVPASDITGILPVANGGTGASTLPVWTTPAYAAGNFTGGNAQTWGVGSGDVQTYAYRIFGNTMTVSFSIITSSVGGTPDPELRIAIPNSKVATKTMYAACAYVNDNGTKTAGFMVVSPSGTYISIQRQDFANWAAAANTTEVYGQITFEIN